MSDTDNQRTLQHLAEGGVQCVKGDASGVMVPGSAPAASGAAAAGAAQGAGARVRAGEGVWAQGAPPAAKPKRRSSAQGKAASVQVDQTAGGTDVKETAAPAAAAGAAGGTDGAAAAAGPTGSAGSTGGGTGVGAGGSPAALSMRGLSFVVTGAVSGMTRERFEALLESRGARLANGLSGTTAALVVGDKPGRAKLDKARSLGVPMLSEDEFFAKYGGDGM